MHTDTAGEMVGRNMPFFERAKKEGIDLTIIKPKQHDKNYEKNLF